MKYGENKNMETKKSTKVDISKVKVIYNPLAGTKRKIMPNQINLEDIKKFLKKYEINADFYPTEYSGHATILAKNAISEKYTMVVAVGGDGTVGEAANGLIGSDLILATIPAGSYMNVARMLSIPIDLEKSIMLLRMGQIRKIDVGAITTLSGKKLDTPYIFLESVGFGLEAQTHLLLSEFEKGNYKAPFTLINTLREYLINKSEITTDDHTIRTRATVINISNGPYSGPAIPIAPDAKLNDHKLTVTVFKMGKFDLIYFFLRLWLGLKRHKKPLTFQSKKIAIHTKQSRLIHADARLYGETPVEITVLPHALTVLTGFVDQSDEIKAFKKPTFISP